MGCNQEVFFVFQLNHCQKVFHMNKPALKKKIEVGLQNPPSAYVPIPLDPPYSFGIKSHQGRGLESMLEWWEIRVLIARMRTMGHFHKAKRSKNKLVKCGGGTNNREFANYKYKWKHKHKLFKSNSKLVMLSWFWIDFYVCVYVFRLYL